jgi:protein-disulfide isomerase
MPGRKVAPSKKSFNIYSLLDRFSKINMIYVLGGLLILASFLIGVLITKVSYLEGTAGSFEAGDISEDIAEEVASDTPVDVAVGQLPVLGEKDAKVTIVEFSDFQCPFCKALYDDTLGKLKEEYINTGKVKFAYRHYPLRDIHPNAQKAAEASECANDQDKFWEYHDTLFEKQAEWESLSPEEANTKFGEYASTLGLDTGSFSECLTSDKHAEKVDKDIEEGSEAGVDATPATYINGYKISGALPYSEFKSIIDRELEK